MSYGTNLADAYRLEGNYVGRIARVRNGNFFLRASLRSCSTYDARKLGGRFTCDSHPCRRAASTTFEEAVANADMFDRPGVTRAVMRRLLRASVCRALL
jgi:hypothetical protein